ncbi:16S rRNA (uracil(1498)-N(3))-methyltransferase [soil metagenome]
MRRFYAPKESFQISNIVLSLNETRHLRDVLRLREDEKVQVFDGEGREFLCEIESITKKETLLKIIEEVTPFAPTSNLDLTLACALLKGEKFDLVVQKAVELGIAKLIPLNTKRADVKFKESEKKTERWRKIALEAAKQCGRADLMKIELPVDFAEFIKNAADAKILFSERGGESFSAIRKSEKMIAFVGSEGGWEDSEIELATSNGCQIITLGGRILRAETAAIAITAILQNNFGDVN